MAWSKKITCDGKSVTFAHDFPTEINNRLREYRHINKILKEKQIRFQTPYPARMKIHWDNGSHLYNNATEVTEDMRKRGFQLDLPQKTTINWEQKLTQRAHAGAERTEIDPHASGKGSEIFIGSNVNTTLIELLGTVYIISNRPNAENIKYCSAL